MEEAPAVEEQPKAEEPKVEEKKETPAEPVKKAKSTGKTGENKPKPKKKPAKKPTAKKPKVEKPAPVEEGPKDIFEKIPGRFIVKSNRGYVISKSEFSDIKSKARVFDDFNEARRYKAMFGGKVIKL